SGGAAGWLAVAGVLSTTAAIARSQAQEARQPRVCAGAPPDGDLRPCRSNSRHGRCVAAGYDQLRRSASSAVVPHRTKTAAAGYGELSAPASGSGAHHAGCRLHELACGGVRMSGVETSSANTAAHTADTPQL